MRKMRRNIAVLILLFIVGVCVVFWPKRTVRLGMNNTGDFVLDIKSGNGTITIYPWSSQEGVLYFILPSFVKTKNIYCGETEEYGLTVDGESLRGWSYFKWDKDTIYEIAYGDKTYRAAFVKSANLTAFFIDTQSGGMDYLDADRNHEEQGYLRVVSPQGNVEYAGKFPRISERGNSTFSAWKRSYTIKLDKAYPLCGIEAGKKWNLLSLFYEHDKIHSKIIYDMAQFLDMEYAPDSTWVDLYCNGEYKGLYLLTKTVTVGEGRVDIYDLDKENKRWNDDVDFDTLLPVRLADTAYFSIRNPEDISGGYLIEKEIDGELRPDEAFFTTAQYGYTFVVREPQHASERQVAYISEFVQGIEDSFAAGTQEYKKNIDIESFAKQFLIDKIVMESDGMNASTFYYKDKGEDVLRSGPIWDYDRAMGEAYPDYTMAMEDQPGGMNGWYMSLYEDEEFYDALTANFEKLLPYMEELLDYGIDGYAGMLQEAVEIDIGIMGQYPKDETRSYSEYESYVRYLKYFLANRLNYLIELWNIPHDLFELEESNGQMHTVVFLSDEDTVLTEYEVEDGTCLTQLPVLHDPEEFGWRFYNTDKFYDVHIPIYEDTVLIERAKDNSSYIEYKIGNLQAEERLEGYLEKLNDEDFSCVIYVYGGVDAIQGKNYIEQMRKLSHYGVPDGDLEQCLLVIDNGWQAMWQTEPGRESGEFNTTFGLLRYGTDDAGQTYLYINGQELNYLDTCESDTPAMLIIAVNRGEGSVADVAEFTAAGCRLRD